MAYWAEIDENNKVLRVTVGNDNDAGRGYEWLVANLGGTWLETTDDGSMRFNLAAIGYTYDPIDDAFIAPAPCEHIELTLNSKKQWECSNVEHPPPM